jgi:hypothetical protein
MYSYRNTVSKRLSAANAERMPSLTSAVLIGVQHQDVARRPGGGLAGAGLGGQRRQQQQGKSVGHGLDVP